MLPAKDNNNFQNIKIQFWLILFLKLLSIQKRFNKLKKINKLNDKIKYIYQRSKLPVKVTKGKFGSFNFYQFLYIILISSGCRYPPNF